MTGRLYTMYSMARAKIVNEGGTQVVQLPHGCRFPEDVQEVDVRQDGSNIVLEPPRPVRSWSREFLATFGALDEDFERLPQQSILELKDPFE